MNAKFVAIAVLCLASTGLADDRPTWVDHQDKERFPAKRFMTGVGAAPIGGNMTKARSFAGESARSELAKTIRTTVKSATSAGIVEELTMDGKTKTVQSKDTVKWDSRSAVDQSLQGVKIEEYWEDEDKDTLYALAVLDLGKLVDDVRRWITEQEGTLQPKWVKSRKAADDGDYVGALRAAEAVVSALPKTPDNYYFLQAVAPGSVENFDLDRGQIESTMRDLMRSIAVKRVVEPVQPLQAGKPIEIKLRVAAAELPVRVTFEPSSVPEQKLRVDEDNALIISVSNVQPDSRGQFVVKIVPDVELILGKNARLATAVNTPLLQIAYRVEGDGPLVVIAVTETAAPCRADTQAAVFQAVAECYRKQGFRAADLQSLKPEVFEQMQGVTINKFTYESIIERSLGPIAKRFIQSKAVCTMDEPMKLDGGGELHLARISYEERNLKTGQAGKLDITNLALEVTGAGPSKEFALKAAQQRLASSVCEGE